MLMVLMMFFMVVVLFRFVDTNILLFSELQKL